MRWVSPAEGVNNMALTLTQMLTGMDPERLAQRIAKVQDSSLEKTASQELQDGLEDGDTEDDTSFGIDADTLGGSGPDPEELEKTASKVEDVISVLSNLRQDLELDDLLNLEAKRNLGGRELRSAADLHQPLEKKASKGKLTEETKALIFAELGRQ